MGRPVVKFTLTNFLDIAAVELGHLTPDKIRRVVMDGVVDTGATTMVLPLSVVQLLGMPISGRAAVTYADRRQEMRDITDYAHVQLCDRGGNFNAIIEPARKDAFIGAVIMEQLDLLVDCKNLTVHRRNENYIVAEIE